MECKCFGVTVHVYQVPMPLHTQEKKNVYYRKKKRLLNANASTHTGGKSDKNYWHTRNIWDASGMQMLLGNKKWQKLLTHEKVTKIIDTQKIYEMRAVCKKKNAFG